MSGNYADRKVSCPTPAGRFWQRVRPTESGCWEWTGGLILGYASFGLRSGKTVLGHRFSYESSRGAIPDGMQLDHLCRNRRCVNPWHLEPVTLAENIRRGSSPSAITSRTATCKRGHPFTPETTFINDHKRGTRTCRECSRLRQRKEWKVAA